VEPWHYYFWVFPVLFLPWSLVLPGGIAWGVRRFREHPGLRFALIAFVVTLLEFTASKSRRSYYILPAFPFAALVVAGFLGDVVGLHGQGLPLRRVWTALAAFPAFILPAFLALGAAFFMVGPILPGPVGQLGREFPLSLPLGAVLAGLLGLWIIARRRRDSGGLLAVGATAALTVTLYLSLGVEAIRARRNPERLLIDEVKARFEGEEISYFGAGNTRLTFYLGVGPQKVDFDGARKLIDGDREEVFLLLRDKELERLKGSWPPDFEEVVRIERPAFGPFRSEKTEYVLLRLAKK
jgi:4-amino-4-deoxy-L-arabinose transferase-like glycosyltransferase